MNKHSKILLGLLTISVAFSCSKKEANNNIEAQTLTISIPIQIDTLIEQDYVADIHAIQNIEIRARVKGYLDRIHVDEGKFVKKGQIMFSINNQDYLSELARAKAVFNQTIAELKAEELSLKNTKLLVDKNVISANQLAIAMTKVDGLKAKKEEALSHVRTAELKVEYSNIRAPFDGVVDRLPFKRGSLIDEGTLLTTLSDTKEMYAYFNVSEKEYLAFAEDTKDVSNKSRVELVLANGEKYPHKGIVETIEGEFDKNTGSIAFRARFPNAGFLLRHGSSGKILLPKKIQKHWIIPQKSVFEIQEKNYVFIKDANGQVKMKSIIPNIRIPHFYLVKTGFSQKDSIIIEGIQLVKQGDKIKSQFVTMQSIIQDLKGE
jgi:RND family efflux transporter MFP subunit